MKKLLLFFVMLIIPITVNAEVNYKITDFYVDADIDIAGSMNVKELIVIDGSLNGYERDIEYKNVSLPDWKEGDIDFKQSSIYAGYSLSNVVVKAKKITSNISFDTFNEDFDILEETDYASVGTKGVYVPSELANGNRFRMYYPASNERIAFLISYTVTNVVVLHNDVAEIYWPFVGRDFEDDIATIKVRLLLPSADSSDVFRIWAHGNLNGQISYLLNDKQEPVGSLAEINDYKAGNELDVRMTFDKKLIPILVTPKESKVDALDKIIEVETERANNANKQRQAIKMLYYGTIIVSIVYALILIVLWIYIYLKYDKEYKSNFTGKYYREFINDYDVEVIDYLFRKSITPNAMSASIMNLIYKKNIEVSEVPGKKKEYNFKLLNEKNLSDNEKYLIDFLFNQVGKNGEFTTKDLHKYASSTKTYSKFTTSYETWKTKVLRVGMGMGFFESNVKIKIAGILYAILGFFIFIFAVANQVISFIPYLLIIPSLVFLIYMITFNKRTRKGNDDFLKWKAFKKFLLDFSILPERELPEIAIWERYMVYATVLGVADKVRKVMNVRIKEIDPTGTMYSPTFHSFVYLNMSNTINRAVTSAVRESVNRANANSSSSSGSGFGGGFSSGGGGGFGGGGGGRGF